MIAGNCREGDGPCLSGTEGYVLEVQGLDDCDVASEGVDVEVTSESRRSCRRKAVSNVAVVCSWFVFICRLYISRRFVIACPIS